MSIEIKKEADVDLRNGKPLKGCLLLQRQFAHVGHAIARDLAERYGVREFCGYVYLRSSDEMLKAQRDIAYTTLLLDEDLHERWKTEPLDPPFLESIEREYGIPFCWPFLAVDRVLMSNQLVREYPYDKPPYTHEELLRMFQVRARAILDMLDRERPDFLFCSVLGGVGSYFLYAAAKKRGIRVFIIHPALLPNRWILSDRFERFTWVDDLALNRRAELRQMPAWEEARTFIDAFRGRPTPYSDRATPTANAVSRRKQFKFLNPINAVRSFREFAKSVVIHYTTPYRHDYSYIGPWNYLRDMIKRKSRNLVGTSDLYDAFTPDEDFAFFPLQYEPEISTLLHAPYHTNQLTLVKQIAISLPVRLKLYVKEHPQMVEYRPRRFYKELKKIPNVKLIAPSVSSFAITPRAKIIFTTTGTVGWEGVLMRKPVISFGEWFYNAIPMVKHCAEMETLPTLVRRELDTYAYDEDAMQAFVAALIAESAVVDLPRLWTMESDPEKRKEGVRPITDLLAAKLFRP